MKKILLTSLFILTASFANNFDRESTECLNNLTYWDKLLSDYNYELKYGSAFSQKVQAKVLHKRCVEIQDSCSYPYTAYTKDLKDYIERNFYSKNNLCDDLLKRMQ